MKPRVLLVDDEKDFLDIMSERLGARGMDVTTTTSAEEAIKMVEEDAYDAVIMDLMMPAMDGFKAMKLLLKIQTNLQIILLTGDVPQEKCDEAIRLGALDVIEKPADLNYLTQRIKEAKTSRNI